MTKLYFDKKKKNARENRRVIKNGQHWAHKTQVVAKQSKKKENTTQKAKTMSSMYPIRKSDLNPGTPEVVLASVQTPTVKRFQLCSHIIHYMKTTANFKCWNVSLCKYPISTKIKSSTPQSSHIFNTMRN